MPIKHKTFKCPVCNALRALKVMLPDIFFRYECELCDGGVIMISLKWSNQEWKEWE